MCQQLGDAGQIQGQYVVAMACIFIPRLALCSTLGIYMYVCTSFLKRRDFVIIHAQHGCSIYITPNHTIPCGTLL